MPSVGAVFGGGLNPDGLSVLSADLYAASSEPAHFSVIGLYSSSGFFAFGWGAGWYFTPSDSAKWQFYGLDGSFENFLGGYDQKVRMAIVVDGAANEVYGEMTHVGGVFRTTSSVISDSQIAAIDGVLVSQDFRDSLYVGFEVDNILLVTQDANAVPEPSSIAMFAAGVGGLLLWARQKRATAA